MNRHIPWFNPREMDDATLLALATGRERLIGELFTSLQQRLRQPAPGGHWLVTGTRGAGKSYFLRLVQALSQSPRHPWLVGRVRLVLLPEELRNVRAPHELLEEIQRMLVTGNHGRPARWRTEQTEAAWNDALRALLSAFDEELLVVGIENFSQLLDKAFKDDVAAALLRKLMAHEPRIFFLATAVDGSFDQNYQQRLFRQFEHHPLPPWDEQAHRRYLNLRAELQGHRPSPRQLARIDAYSRYTGGNARIAAILAAAILDEQDLVDAGADLNATLDKMSDYYRALLEAMPDNSQTLFDALVRGGEPCSQTELAERVGARQNDIVRAFRWLFDAGHLNAERRKGRKETRYQVADRLFVQWYRMRYLEPGQSSRLAVLAELLADTVAFADKWRYAGRFIAENQLSDARLFAELALRERGIALRTLEAEGASLNELIEWGEGLAVQEARTGYIGDNKAPLHQLLDLLAAYPSDTAMRQEFATVGKVVRACHRFPDLASGEQLLSLCQDSLSLIAVDKLRVLRRLPQAGFSRRQWAELTEVFQDEAKEFQRLEPTEGTFIAALRAWRDRKFNLPFTTSWHELSGIDSATTGDTVGYLYERHAPAERTALRLAAATVALWQWLQVECSADHLDRATREIHQLVWQATQTWGLTPLAWSLLEPLLMRWPDGQTPRFRSRIAALGAWLLNDLDRNEQGKVLAESAIAWASDDTATEEMAFALGRLGWILGSTGQWQEAQTAHERALPLLEITDPASAWHRGQAARYAIATSTHSSAPAWALLTAATDPAAWATSFGQLGDAVWDRQRHHGTPAAYALARELIEHLASHPETEYLPALRALFINMLDTGVDVALLDDLAGELPDLLATPRSSGDSLHTLAETLHAWFGSLRQPSPADSPIDPDWSTTLAALNQELNLSAKIRLGLASAATLSDETWILIKRIGKFLHH